MAFDTKLKQWTSLGLGTMLMTGALAGCSEPAAPADDAATEISQPEADAAPASSENSEGANSKKTSSGGKRKSMEEAPAAKKESDESPPKKTKICDAAAEPAVGVNGKTCTAS